MMNSDPPTSDADDDSRQELALYPILRSGATGAIALAVIATTIVVALWFAFYFLVFVPRAGAP